MANRMVVIGRNGFGRLCSSRNSRWGAQRVESRWTSYQPLPWRGWVVVGTSEGRVIAFDLESGETVWSLEVQGIVRGVGGDGDVIYVGTLDGMVYACKVTLPGEPKAAVTK